jgi:hypothetical protein
MINYFIKKLLCLIKNHKYIYAGSCPFTKNTYMVCSSCQRMLSI